MYVNTLQFWQTVKSEQFTEHAKKIKLSLNFLLERYYHFLLI